MDVEIVAGREPPALRVRSGTTAEPMADEQGALARLAEQLVALGYPEWLRDCARIEREGGDAATLTFELACKHEGTVSGVRKLGPRGACVECTRCGCRLYEDDDLWHSPPRHGWTPRD